MQTQAFPLPKRTIRQVVVHCSATPSGQWLGGKRPGVEGYVTAPAVIDGWHLRRGFKRDAAARNAFNWRFAAIGYHLVVDLDGHVWTGRHLNEVGAHVQGHNANSIGICLVGGAEREARYTRAQWLALAEQVRQLQPLLSPNPNGPQVCGHRDLSPDLDGDGRVQPNEWLKTCPGFDVSAWLAGDMQPLASHSCEVLP